MLDYMKKKVYLKKKKWLENYEDGNKNLQKFIKLNTQQQEK